MHDHLYEHYAPDPFGKNTRKTLRGVSWSGANTNNAPLAGDVRTRSAIPSVM